MHNIKILIANDEQPARKMDKDLSNADNTAGADLHG